MPRPPEPKKKKKRGAVVTRLFEELDKIHKRLERAELERAELLKRNSRRRSRSSRSMFDPPDEEE